jgi:hypothetical protein
MMDFIAPSKGFERLLFELGDKKELVHIHLQNRVAQGVILKVESGILVLEEITERFRKNVSYIPVQQILSVSYKFE